MVNETMTWLTLLLLLLLLLFPGDRLEILCSSSASFMSSCWHSCTLLLADGSIGSENNFWRRFCETVSAKIYG
jgi:hypothetical protein